MAKSPGSDYRSGKPVVILDPDDGTPMIIMPIKPEPAADKHADKHQGQPISPNPRSPEK